jgi:hypothetical protein
VPDIVYKHLEIKPYNQRNNKNIETLLFGNDEISISENSNIFNKVRAYIRQTKRF